MIVDFHAHYANNCYKKPFRYLTRDENGYALAEGELPQLMQEMEEENVRYFVEPGVSLQSCEEVLPYCKDILPPKLLRRTRNTSMILLAERRMVTIFRFALVIQVKPEVHISMPDTAGFIRL